MRVSFVLVVQWSGSVALIKRSVAVSSRVHTPHTLLYNVNHNRDVYETIYLTHIFVSYSTVYIQRRTGLNTDCA